MNHQFKFNSLPLHIVGFCFLAVLFICLAVPVQAQLSGTYTIGSGGNYATFSAAVTDLNSLGVNGAVTFNVFSGTYTEQFAIGNISGSSVSNTITFQSQSGIAADVTIQYTPTSAGDNYVAQLNGTDFITFQNMTFTAWGTSYGRIFVLNDNSDNNNILNCVLNGVSTTSTSTNLALVFCSPTSLTSDNPNIRNNTFNNGSYGIYFSGVNTALLVSGTEIEDNTFNNVSRGMFLQYQQDLLITGNTIVADGDQGIYVNYADGATLITKNMVRTGSGNGIYINNSDGGVPPTGTPGLIANNFVTSFSNSARGIYLVSSTRQKVYYNSTNTPSGTNSRAFEMSGGSDINVVNNIFSAPGGGYAYVVSTPAAIDTSDYNNFYSPGNYPAYWGTSNLTNLAALQSASGKDANSRSVYPHYTSNTDLHTAAPWLDGVGTTLPEVSDDIDGQARGNSPDIGADQFVPDPTTTTPMSGIYTIGSGGDYTNFNDVASDLLLKGISAPVTFDILNGTYVEQVTFLEIPGASSSDTVTFQSQSGNAADVILRHFAAAAGDNWIVRLFGADYLRFSNMTMMANNVAPVSFGGVIQLWGGVENLTIEGNVFDGSPTTSTSTNLAIIYGTDMLSSPRIFRNNTFNNGSYGIYFSGVNTALLVSGTEIEDNTFNNVSRGMFLQYQQDLLITGNTIVADGDQGIYVNYADGATLITKNMVRTGSGNGIYINNSDGGVPPTGTPGLIANNFVTSFSNSARGIYLVSSTRQKVYYNSTNTPSGTNSRAFEMSGGSDINVVNNIFSAPGGGYAYVVSTPAAIDTSDYNNFYSPGNYPAYWGTSNLTNLAALQSASGKDANSRSVYPHYTSNTDLHTAAPWLDGVGTTLPEVSDDIDGQARGNSPDIGADQFVPDPTTTTPMSGIYTIGSGGDYTNFNDVASDLLLKGISAPVTFDILNGTYVEQVTFLEIPGASSSDTVTFQSQSGNAADVILRHFAAAAGDNWIVRLFGADYLRFSNMTMMANNVAPVSFGGVIQLWGGVENLTIEGNVFDGSPTTSTSTNLAIIYGTDMLSSPRIFRNNTFNNGSYGIYFSGVNTALLVSGTEIEDNTFNNVSRGMFLQYQQDLLITGNTIVADGDQGIYVNYADGATLITKNMVRTGSGNGIYINNSDGGVPPTGTPGLIANNFVTSFSNSARGIYLVSSTRQKVYYNSTNTPSGTNSRAFEMSGGSDINVVNNIFSAPGGGYAYVVSTPAAIDTSDYNNFYSPGNYPAYWGTSNLTNLAALQSASGKDANSRSVYPHYTSNTDLHTAAPWLDGVGTTLPEVSDDIDGQARGNSPDIGADQFVPDPTTTTPMSGIYTIGSGGDYTNFNDVASDLLLKGISAPVTFDILNGTYVEQVTFLEIPGASSSDTVTFQSQSGNAADVILRHFAAAAGDNWIVRLFGADYLRFSNMTMMANNVAPVSFGGVIQLWGGVENLTIEGNVFDGSPTTSTSTNLAIIYGTDMLSSPRIFRNNTFNNGSYGIYFSGVNTALLVSGTEIEDNTFNNVSRGMFLQYQQDLLITGNTIVADGDQGIYVNYADGATLITKNMVRTGSGNGIYINNSDGGVPPTGTPGLIANNFVTSFSNSARGIYLVSSTRQKVYYNSTNTPSGTNSRAFEMSGGSDINVVNNIFSAPGGGYAYVVSTPAAIDTSDYNDFFVTDTILAYWNGNVSNLAALQAASGKDANSITVNPQFISNTNLHARATEVDSMAMPLVAVTEDIDGETRDATFPDIGADEFTFGFNYAPEITSQPDTMATVDSLYEYQVTATDQNGDTLVFRLTLAPGFLSIDTTTGLISGTPLTGDVGDHTITVEVDDQKGGTDTQTYTLHVIPIVGIDPFFNQIPKEFVIYQNYPNPFNPVTHIRYGVPRAAHVKIEVYNSLGQKLTELVNEYRPAGYHHANFEASSFASGIYFYRIVAGDYQVVKKMMLLK